MNDLKLAFRQLLKNPGFTAVAVSSLTLGIAANTTIFSFVNVLLLRPPPVEQMNVGVDDRRGSRLHGSDRQR